MPSTIDANKPTANFLISSSRLNEAIDLSIVKHLARQLDTAWPCPVEPDSFTFLELCMSCYVPKVILG